MILGSNAIRDALTSGAIVCDPAPGKIEGTHIDVTIGEQYWLRDPGVGNIHIGDVDPHRVFRLHHAFITNNDIVIPPGFFALCHTMQFIGTTVPDLLPILHTRSTFARHGLSVHESAGLGDCGFVSRWTLEIWNHRHYPILIPVGARVGCVSFERVEGNDELYVGRYNVSKEEWTPEAMLPRQGNF